MERRDTAVQFPNLFVETVQPTIASITAFAFADVRRIARETDRLRESGSNKLLSLPISGRELLKIWQENRDMIKPRLRTSHYKVVDYLIDEFLENHTMEVTSIDDVTIQHCGDDHALNECVYTIITNSKLEQVTLSFRGSITMQDWITDAKLVSGALANPLYDPEDKGNNQPEFVGVHRGFRDYLYDVKDPLIPPISLSKLQSKIKKVTSKEEEEELEEATVRQNKIDVILDQVQELMDANPGYKLYITGHSLGGALAMLTSVQASVRFAQPGIPVTCVTIANPRVGDNRFRAAIQALEQRNMLRILTVHNFLDLVPSAPSRMCRCDFCKPNKFCMPGIRIVLKERSFLITYHSATDDTRWEELQGEFQRFFIALCCFWQAGPQHNYQTYLNRLVAQKDKLSRLYLNDLYREQGIDFDKPQDLDTE